MARKKIINRTHKNPSSDGIDLNVEVGGDLLGMSGGKTNPSLKAFEDVDETDPEKVGGSVAAIEATLKYVDSILKEDDEDLPDEDDPELDSDEDMEDDDEDFEDDGDTGFGDEGDDDVDMDECGLMEDDDPEIDDVDDEDADLDDDEDMEDDEDLGDLDDDELSDPEDDEDVDDDLAEGFLFEGDDGLDDMSDDTEVVSTEPDSDLDDDMGDDDVTGAISVDLPEDIDPNDVEVTVGDSTYVPDIDSGEDTDSEMDDSDMDTDDDMEDDMEDDMPVSESYGLGRYGYNYNKFGHLYEGDEDLGDEDDVDLDDEDMDDDTDTDLDDVDDASMDDDMDDVDDEDMNDEDDDELDVSEAAVMKALNNILAEDERSDNSLNSDPSDYTGDEPIDDEEDIDDSEDKESGLSGSEGEVSDADIPIEKGTIQPEEAAELRFMASRLKDIMEGDDESHKDDGKFSAEPLDGEAQDMIGDISDSLEDDGSLTDTGDGAVEDGESTLGSPDEAEDIADDDVEFTSSNGEGVDEDDLEDDETHLTDNYYKVMTAINEACKKCGKKGNKKAAVKKAVKKALAKKKVTPKKGKKFKMVKESAYPELDGVADYIGNSSLKPVNKSATATAQKGADAITEKTGKTLENTVLGNFNKSEMTSVLKSLNNAFGTGSTSVSKEIRDSKVVSEVSVPTKALPIAENASWDGIKSGKMLMETAYKSESKVNTNLLKMTHLYWENDGSEASDYKFPIAALVEGQAQIIPQAIDEATQLFASPSFILRFSESALKKIRNVLDFYNEKMGKKSPWKSKDQIKVSEATKITMIDRTSYNPYAVLKRISEQENAKKLINLRG